MRVGKISCEHSSAADQGAIAAYAGLDRSAHQSGQAFTFSAPDDEAMIRDIERVLGQRIERRQLAGFHNGDMGRGNESGNGGQTGDKQHSNARTTGGKKNGNQRNSAARRRRQQRRYGTQKSVSQATPPS